MSIDKIMCYYAKYQKQFFLQLALLIYSNFILAQNIFAEKYIEKEPAKRIYQNEISVSDGIEILNYEFKETLNKRKRFSFTLDDWDNSAVEFIQISIEDFPLLNSNDFADENLTVITLVKYEEILRVLDTKNKSVKLKNPWHRFPSSFGTWKYVETIDGFKGWVFMRPLNLDYSFATILEKPKPPPMNFTASESYKDSQSSIPLLLIIGIACIAFFIFLKFLNSSYYSAGTYKGYSEDNVSSKREKIYMQQGDYNLDNSESTIDKNYTKKNIKKGQWYNERNYGRVDKDGNIYKGSWYNEDKVGRIDNSGNIYNGKWYNEEKAGRINEKGEIYKGKWYNEEKSGRIDKQGNIYEGKWYNEKKVGNVSDKKSSDCFITTACLLNIGLKDDCFELQALRNFRDSYLESFDLGRESVKNYYKVAPQIVAHLNFLENKDEIYKYLYQNLVIKSILLINENKKYQAYINYKKIVNQLANSFIDVR